MSLGCWKTGSSDLGLCRSHPQHPPIKQPPQPLSVAFSFRLEVFAQHIALLGREAVEEGAGLVGAVVRRLRIPLYPFLIRPLLLLVNLALARGAVLLLRMPCPLRSPSSAAVRI